MSTALQSPAIEAEQRFVVRDVPWERYVQVLDGLGEQRGIRTSFDGRTLELMTTSKRHEWFKEMLGDLLRQFTLERGLPTRSGGSMTFRREDLERGLEPDKCYWIAHESDLRRVEEPDFTIHPPPDLCIEIEVSRTVVDRLAIYAALGVPEVWRFDGRALTVLRLADGAYTASELSIEVDGFPIDEVLEFLDPTDDRDENARIRAFVESIRDEPG
jgi:Uma2 family endonuclease